MLAIGTLVFDTRLGRVGEIQRIDEEFQSQLVVFDDATWIWVPIGVEGRLEVI